jgi:ParB-like chromosome segregation protein Spo0J
LAHIAPDLRGLAIAIDTLTPDPSNARTHSPRNLDVIRGSLLKFGQVKPIVIDPKGIVLAGNGSLVAALSLGWKYIAAVRTTLEGAMAAGYALADNRSAELAEWDRDALARTLQALQGDQAFDVLATGFDPGEIERLIREANGGGDLPGGAAGKEFGEGVADEVKKCPHCGGVL